MTTETAKRYVTLTWLVGALMMLVMLFGGYIINGMGASIIKLQDSKVEQKEYSKDYKQQREDFAAINTKLDNLPEIIIKQIQRSGINNHRPDTKTSWEVRK